MQPLIGITLDSEPAGGWSAYPWYAVRQNYFDAVARAGGVPVGLPHTAEQSETYLARLGGLLVTGGNFDIDPSLYGDDHEHETVTRKDQRTQFEWAVTKGALARDMPVLGICGGQQLLHVVLGGALIQHIPDEVPGALAHEQPNPRDEPGHSVSIMPGTLLHDIVRADTLEVNSAHHQAAKDSPGGIVIDAKAPDGVIEGIEHGDYRFCLGVQWHPEYLISDADRRIFDAFVKAST